MKYHFILILFLFVFLGVEGCGGQLAQVQSWWIEDAPLLDGNSNDWSESPLEYYLEKENVSLGVRNDSTDLYLLLRFSDARWAHRIGMFGVTLWLDREGGKAKTFGVRYGGSIALRDSLRRGPSDLKGMPSAADKMPESGLLEPGTVTLIHDDQEVTFPESNAFGPKASSSYQVGFFCYEFKIPLREDGPVVYAVGVGLGDRIGLGIEFGGMDSDAMNKTREEMGEMAPPGGGMGGPQMGGMGGPPGGGMGEPPGGFGERPDMGPKEFWFEVTLAEGFVDL